MNRIRNAVPAKMIRPFYRVGKQLPELFFPWGPIFEFCTNYLTVVSLGLLMSKLKKCLEPVLFPGVLFLSKEKLPESGCAESVTEHGCSWSISWCCVCVNSVRKHTRTYKHIK